MIGPLLLVLLGCVAALDVYVTWRIVRDDLSTPGQRWAQAALVWLVPVLGALLVLHLQRKQPERSSGSYRDAPDAGDDLAAAHVGRGRRRERDEDEPLPADAAHD